MFRYHILLSLIIFNLYNYHIFSILALTNVIFRTILPCFVSLTLISSLFSHVTVKRNTHLLDMFTMSAISWQRFCVNVNDSLKKSLISPLLLYPYIFNPNPSSLSYIKRDGSTALIYASDRGHIDTVKSLIAVPSTNVNYVNVSINPLSPLYRNNHVFPSPRFIFASHHFCPPFMFPFIVSPPQNNGKKAIDVAKNEVSCNVFARLPRLISHVYH